MPTFLFLYIPVTQSESKHQRVKETDSRKDDINVVFTLRRTKPDWAPAGRSWSQRNWHSPSSPSPAWTTRRPKQTISYRTLKKRRLLITNYYKSFQWRRFQKFVTGLYTYNWYIWIRKVLPFPKSHLNKDCRAKLGTEDCNYIFWVPILLL